MLASSTSLLEIERKNLLNSIDHLQRSIQELKDAIVIEGDDFDGEYKDAISENIVAIARYRTRVHAIDEELARAAGGPPPSVSKTAAPAPAQPPAHSFLPPELRNAPFVFIPAGGDLTQARDITAEIAGRSAPGETRPSAYAAAAQGGAPAPSAGAPGNQDDQFVSIPMEVELPSVAVRAADRDSVGMEGEEAEEWDGNTPTAAQLENADDGGAWL